MALWVAASCEVTAALRSEELHNVEVRRLHRSQRSWSPSVEGRLTTSAAFASRKPDSALLQLDKLFDGRSSSLRRTTDVLSHDILPAAPLAAFGPKNRA